MRNLQLNYLLLVVLTGAIAIVASKLEPRPELTYTISNTLQIENYYESYIPPQETSTTSTTTTTTTTSTTPTTVPITLVPIKEKRLRATAVATSTTQPTLIESLPVVVQNEWEGSIPEYYGAESGCEQDEANIVAKEMRKVGADDVTILWMLKTMSRESTCDPSAYNGDRSTGDNSYGLCQLNTLAGFFKEGEILADYNPEDFANDFELNAEACATLWDICGRGPWNYGNYYCSSPHD